MHTKVFSASSTVFIWHTWTRGMDSNTERARTPLDHVGQITTVFGEVRTVRTCHTCTRGTNNAAVPSAKPLLATGWHTDMFIYSNAAFCSPHLSRGAPNKVAVRLIL
jgi:hypothetical protein